MKKKLLIVALLLVLVAGGTLDTKAEETFELAEPLAGMSENGSQWVLPHFAGQSDAWTAINEYYRLMADELALAETAQSVGFEIVHLSQRYVSIVRIIREMGGNGEYEFLMADTFALDGMYAGQKLSLSQVLGMEENPESSSAAQLVWNLVWQIAAQEAENPQSAYLDGITMQEVQNAFWPESDFYLDADGNIVFWIAPGELAGEMAGVLLFPFAPGELMSAIGEG